MHCYWTPDAESSINTAAAPSALCVGTGRFLRSVLVPLLQRRREDAAAPALIQTRGKSFVEYMQQRQQQQDENSGGTFEVDTVLSNGTVQTDKIACAGAFSLGHDKSSVYEVLLPRMKASGVSILGVGVTEAGLASHTTTAMQDLYELLDKIRQTCPPLPDNDQKICLINTDNVPNNGDVLRQHMNTLAASDTVMTDFLSRKVAFLNSMVDRITSHREGDPMVPRAEPVPAKALVLLDEHGDLPPWFAAQQTKPNLGLVIRRTAQELQMDIALKLRVANGTHTAIAHAMALQGLVMTDQLSQHPILVEYLDALVRDQIAVAACASHTASQEAVDAVWTDWRSRLTHSQFGLSTFFITQNGAAKGGIRLGPTVRDLWAASSTQQPQPILTVTTVLAFATLLRWLTPAASAAAADDGIYTGWLQGTSRGDVGTAKNRNASSSETVHYADGLNHNLKEGWYEFRCACPVSVEGAGGGESSVVKSVSEWLGSFASAQQPAAYVPIIRAYLTAETGGNLGSSGTPAQLDALAQAIATLYARMVAGDGILEMLQEMKDKSGSFTADSAVLVDTGNLRNGRPLHYRPSPIPESSALMHVALTEDSAADVVVSEVASTRVIDLHTHLLPPSHGALCLWGIDELLTYHYCVAEYFMTAPASMTPEIFYSKTKQEQANLVWKHLFVDRTPISEASRGVVTTLVAFGLTKEVQARDLTAIRKFYRQFRDEGLPGAEKFSELVHKLSGVRYNIMTNIPFDPNEAQHWRPKRKEYPDQYRSALRVDPLLSGDRKSVECALKASGYDTTLEGARQFLRDWIVTVRPEYLMASTPHNFTLEGESGRLTPQLKRGVNEEAMKQPGAFAEAINEGQNSCTGADDDSPSIIDEHSDLLSDVLMRVCEELDLPLALKIGAHRGVNPRLKQAGDGVVAFADAGMLGRLCGRFPNVRILATFLSRNNQHEACVLASKFGNLHIYGCWWYCFTPSMVKEITRMRIEMLGTAFTAQHSDARVLDQLIYKWAHSRAIIANVLKEEVKKLCASGWNPTRSEIRRDVGRVFGGSYEEFMTKSWKAGK